MFNKEDLGFRIGTKSLQCAEFPFCETPVPALNRGEAGELKLTQERRVNAAFKQQMLQHQISILHNK